MDGRAAEIDIPRPLLFYSFPISNVIIKKKTGEVGIHAHYKTNDALLT